MSGTGCWQICQGPDADTHWLTGCMDRIYVAAMIVASYNDNECFAMVTFYFILTGTTSMTSDEDIVDDSTAVAST